jgi:hypothetical protein
MSNYKYAPSTGLEPATSALTGQRSNRLSYNSLKNGEMVTPFSYLVIVLGLDQLI